MHNKIKIFLGHINFLKTSIQRMRKQYPSNFPKDISKFLSEALFKIQSFDNFLSALHWINRNHRNSCHRFSKSAFVYFQKYLDTQPHFLILFWGLGHKNFQKTNSENFLRIRIYYSLNFSEIFCQNCLLGWLRILCKLCFQIPSKMQK